MTAGPLLGLVAPSPDGTSRLGLTVSSKVGTAVVRNAVRRRLRELFRKRRDRWPGGMHLVVVARPSAREASFATLEGAADGLAVRVREKSPLKLLAFLLSLPIHLYRWTLSPLLPRACRFHPSCSAYALGALQRARPVPRLLARASPTGRCNPFNPGGLDPVPPRPGRV